MRNDKTEILEGVSRSCRKLIVFFLLMLQVSSVQADYTAISDFVSSSNLNVWVTDKDINKVKFTLLPENKVQIQLSFTGDIPEPKVSQTSNPARISLDFPEVHSNLSGNTLRVNQGPVKAVYVAEAIGKTRVIISLKESVSYRIETLEDKITILVTPSKNIKH